MADLSTRLRRLLNALKANGVTLEIFNRWIEDQTTYMDRWKENRDTHMGCCPWSKPDCYEGPDTCICCSLHLTLCSLLLNTSGTHVHFCGEYSDGQYMCNSINVDELEDFVHEYLRKALE